MKILHLAITVIFVTVLITNTGMVLAQYGPGFSPVEHYPLINDTALKLLVMNSTEFKERTIGYNYTLAGIDHNWTSKGSNYYDFGGARVTFFVFGFENGTTKGDAFNIDSQMKIKNVFEYNADNPPAGYYTDRCMACLLETGVTKPKCCDPYVPIPIKTPLQQFKSGISAMDVQCEQGLELVIKAEDNSPACVKFSTAESLIRHGWASAESGISSDGIRTYIIQDSSASSKTSILNNTSCNTPYLRSDSDITVLYMPKNSIGKICVNYYNLNNTPVGVGIRIIEQNNMTQNAPDIITWASNSTLQGNENTTISYFIKTGNKAGLYGLSMFCGGIPFAGAGPRSRASKQH